MREGDARTEIERGVQLAGNCAHGLDAVLITMDISRRLTREDFESLEAVRSLVGHKCFRERGVIVWTHADLLTAEGVSPSVLLASDAGEAVNDLLNEVQHRNVALDTRGADPSGLHALFEAVGSVVQAQGGVGFSAAEVPKKMRMKQARRMRQLAARQEECATGDKLYWFGWLAQLVAPTIQE
mmetsp:Transcript_4035/g.7403  ORF Transcript_4035/g.7403 Transcript_4035/m.7403 type:complete len:183 (-) Transcript_4035:159-707(-)